jgi:predicted protein tyrosine phosphatase
MKVVAMCQGGQVRSVGLKYILRYKYNHDVLACGFEGNTKPTRDMLFEWADKIVIMQAVMMKYIPEKFRNKTICFDVGPDCFGNPFHPHLQLALESYIQETKIFL